MPLESVDDWSSDGRYLAFTSVKFIGPQNWQNTLRVLRVVEDSKPEVEIVNAANGKFSPDGHWLVFEDNASG